MLSLGAREVLIQCNTWDHSRYTAISELHRRRKAVNSVGAQHQFVEEPDGAIQVGDRNALVRPVNPAEVFLRQQQRVEAVNAVGEIEVKPGVGVGHEHG